MVAKTGNDRRRPSDEEWKNQRMKEPRLHRPAFGNNYR